MVYYYIYTTTADCKCYKCLLSMYVYRKQGSDANGRNYYYNYVTGASQWDPPENWAINLADQWVRILVSLSRYLLYMCIYIYLYTTTAVYKCYK